MKRPWHGSRGGRGTETLSAPGTASSASGRPSGAATRPSWRPCCSHCQSRHALIISVAVHTDHGIAAHHASPIAMSAMSLSII